MATFFNIALIILSVALSVAILLQSRGGGLGSIAGAADSMGQYKTRRGLERTLFQVTIGLAILFFAVVIAYVFFLQ